MRSSRDLASVFSSIQLVNDNSAFIAAANCSKLIVHADSSLVSFKRRYGLHISPEEQKSDGERRYNSRQIVTCFEKNRARGCQSSKDIFFIGIASHQIVHRFTQLNEFRLIHQWKVAGFQFGDFSLRSFWLLLLLFLVFGNWTSRRWRGFEHSMQAMFSARWI